MFSLFPSQWVLPLPRRKLIKSLADHHFPQQPVTVKIARPVPASVPRPATPKVKKPVVNAIPPCEMLKPEEEIDVTEIDKMLSELETPCLELRTERILQMVQTVNQQLEKNIIVIRNAPAVDGDIVSRDNLLKLLKMFSDYSKTIEQYIKETMPSLR